MGRGLFVFPAFRHRRYLLLAKTLTLSQKMSARVPWVGGAAGLLGLCRWFWADSFLVSGKKKSTTRIWGCG